MSRSKKSAWLEGPSDLKEDDVVVDFPEEGDTVKVRGLPAAYSNQATSDAMEQRTWPNGQQTATIDTNKMEIIKFAHGCVDPSFDTHEAEIVFKRLGPAVKKVVAKIDELSGVDENAVADTHARFPSSGDEPSGQSGSNGSAA